MKAIIKPVVPMSERHIVAIGGGLAKLPAQAEARMIDCLLHWHQHYKDPVEIPRIILLDTAKGDAAGAKLRWLETMQLTKRRCQLSFLSLFDRTPVDLTSLLLSQDIIYVGGGNTKSMLAVWREYGIDKLLWEAWQDGIMLAGTSAGGICWFESCVTDSYADSFTSLPALGFLPGSCCPHYDGEAGRREAYHAMIRRGELPAGYAIDEGTAAHFIGAELSGVVTVSPNPNASVYKVDVKVKGGLVQEAREPAVVRI